MPMRQLIFVVESETETSRLSRHYLEGAGYFVRTFANTEVEVLEEAERTRPALCLVALGSQDGSGVALCRRIRASRLLARTPVVFMLEGGAEEHRILALDSGGDDCIVKPFNPRELVARIQAVLRRLTSTANDTRSEAADIMIDSSAMKLTVRGLEIPITSLEFRLIEYLAQHRGQVFTRDLLLDAVWGDMQFVTPRSVDACIRRIREKIEPDRETPTYLKTIRGVGYRLDAVAAWQLTASAGCTCAACTAPMGVSKIPPRSKSRRRRVAQAD
jgi:DNA-binding response OmpR family regulator